MLLTNEFRSALSPDELFALLADVERVTPCLPGATLEGRDGDRWAGRMRVRVGPVAASYRGTLRQAEVDSDARRTVIVASADDEHGAGSAEARMTASVEPLDEGSLARVEMDLQLRGRVAQFGRGAIDGIAQRMLDSFAANVERVAAAPEAPEPATAAPAGAAAPATAALDLLPVSVDRSGVRLALAAAAAFVAGLGYGYLAGRLREARRAP